jgi:predicted nucleotidyltransferase
MDANELTVKIRQSLETTFGARLQGVVLYGSEARGEADPKSDVDVLVLLGSPIRLWDDARAAALALQDIQTEIDRPIHAVPVDAETYAKRGYALYRAASREGITA